MHKQAAQRLFLLGLTFTSSLSMANKICNQQSSSTASECDSDSQMIRTENHFQYGSCIRPHPEKEYKGGEDALFTSSQLLSVMDGVGGWAEHGVDPAKYSKQLAIHMSQLWHNNIHKYIKNPKLIIIDSARLNTEIGSSTCCVLTIDPVHPLIYASYIGDSGYVIFRKDQITNQLKMHHMYQEHTHGFNFPYQIGSQGDNPDQSLTYKHIVQQDDIVVVGTDGLFDNLDGEQIKSIIQTHLKLNQGSIKYEGLSKEIAEFAKEKSLLQSYLSPFAKRAIDYGYYFTGGKSDDITVIVAQVKLQQQQEQKQSSN